MPKQNGVFYRPWRNISEQMKHLSWKYLRMKSGSQQKWGNT
jgi:hypothetical protein